MRKLLCAVVVMSGWLGGCATQGSVVPLENGEGKADTAKVGFALREAGDETSFSVSCDDEAGCDLRLHVSLDEAFLEERFEKAGLPLDEPHAIASLTFYDDKGEPHEEMLSTELGCPVGVTCSEYLFAQKTLTYAALPQSRTGDYVLTIRRVDDALGSLRFHAMADWRAPARIEAPKER